MKISTILFGPRPKNAGYFIRLLASLCFQWFGLTTVALVWSLLGLYSPWYFSLSGIPVMLSFWASLANLDIVRYLLDNPILLVLFGTLPIALLVGTLCLEFLYSKFHLDCEGWSVHRQGNWLVILSPDLVYSGKGNAIDSTQLPAYLCNPDAQYENVMDPDAFHALLMEALQSMNYPPNYREQLYNFVIETKNWI